VRLASFSLLAVAALSLAGCASSKLDMSTTAPVPDRRVGLGGASGTPHKRRGICG